MVIGPKLRSVMSKYLTGLCLVAFGLAVGFFYQSQFSAASERVLAHSSEGSRRPPSAVARPLPAQEHFIQVKRDAHNAPESLQVGIGDYEGRGVRVSLVGAVHIADKEYFEHLNRELGRYDTVLYELVAPKNTVPVPHPNRKKGLYSSMQEGFGEMLGFVHQVETVDYQKPHFVHADLSMDDLMAEGKKRGESKFTLMAGVLLDLIKSANRDQQEVTLPEMNSLEDMITFLKDPRALKGTFAEMFEKQQSLEGFSSVSPYLIELRNNEAMRVLKEEIAAGKKNIAIFYGAAHLPDMERQLIEDFGMRRVATRWVNAWDLQKPVEVKPNPVIKGLEFLEALQNM